MKSVVLKSIIISLLSVAFISCQEGSSSKSVQPATSSIQNNAIAIEGGGDHAGNGGFAYEKTYGLLELASQELLDAIEKSDYEMFEKFPSRKQLLLDVLRIDSIIQLPEVDDVYRDDKLLALDYSIYPKKLIKLYKPFFVRFSNVVDSIVDESLEEMKILLAHEAAHLWGYGDVQARAFAKELIDYNSISHAVTKRPNKVVFVESSCVCEKGTSRANESCSNFCSKEDYTEDPTLFMTLGMLPNNPSDMISTPYEWCNKSLDDSVAPACALVIFNENMSLVNRIAITIQNDNKVQVNISTLTKHKYFANIIELDSGTQIEDTFNFSLPDPEYPEARPITLEPISSYSCVMNAGTVLDSVETILASSKMSFYFPSTKRPPALSPDEKFTLCHDPSIPGQTMEDSIFYKRLLEKQNAFTLWRSNDSMFQADPKEPNLYKIDTKIREHLALLGDTSTDYQIFHPLLWTNSPSSKGLSLQGFYMDPLEDSGMPFCPDYTLYSSDETIGHVLSGYIDDTEAIYMAERESELIVINNSELLEPNDYMLIRESILKEIWFYFDYQSGKMVKGDYINSMYHTMMFYWPRNLNDPLAKLKGSSLYVVKHPNEISSIESGNFSSDIPSDKRFGCIPTTPFDYK